MPQGFALEEASKLEVITAFAAAQQSIPAVEEAPGWYVVGSFWLPKSCQARLDVAGSVSAEGLALTLRLFDVAEAAAVSGSTASTQAITPSTRFLSGKLDLPGQRMYQIQAQCVGAVGDDKFGIVNTASLSD
jgi:hypothetical protein